MQAQNENNRIYLSEIAERSVLEKKKNQLLESGKASKVVIGELPRIGSVLFYNELAFKVTKVMSRGRRSIKLIGSD